jgi:hypothetical protein
MPSPPAWLVAMRADHARRERIAAHVIGGATCPELPVLLDFDGRVQATTASAAGSGGGVHCERVNARSY